MQWRSLLPTLAFSPVSPVQAPAVADRRDSGEEGGGADPRGGEGSAARCRRALTAQPSAPADLTGHGLPIRSLRRT